MGRRFARQRFADSRESIRKKMLIFEALGQIRANRVFSPIYIEIRVICVQSSLAIPFFGRSIPQKNVFFSKRESIRANRPTNFSTERTSNQGQKGTPQNFCDKDVAELSGELSGAICLRILVLVGSALELFRKFFGTVRAFFWLWVLFEKNSPENGEWFENGISGHFSTFRPMFPPFFRKSVFRPFSSPFRARGTKWIYTRSTGFQH